MRVAIDPASNLAAGVAAAEPSMPSKHKPLLQARRNQYEDYRNLKDRDFLSLHEEVTHLRQCTRDQERIIALLKEEKNRLLAELLQKGKDLQHARDILHKQSNPQQDDRGGSLADLKRVVAERDTTIDELKSEIVRLNGLHQRTLEDHDDLIDQIRSMEQQVLTAEQTAAHKAADVLRLEEAIRLLNEEMTERMNNLGKQMNQAAEVGRRDATTDHNLLEEELANWKAKCQESQVLLKRFQDEEQRHKGLALQQQMTANEAVAEKVELLAELRRQQVLLAEVDELKAQVASFRLNQVASESLLREKLNVALLDIHEEKQLTRKLMSEVDKKEDEIAARERDIARLTREYELKLIESVSTFESKSKTTIDELQEVLKNVQKEKIYQVEELTKCSIRLEASLKQCQQYEADIAKLRAELQSTSTKEHTLQLRVVELEDALGHAHRALGAAMAEASAQRQQQLTTTTTDASGSWKQEREQLVAEHNAQLEEVVAEAQLLDADLTQCRAQMQSLEVQLAALRESQTEHDAIRHTALVTERNHAQEQVALLEKELEDATEALETLTATSQRLRDELDDAQQRLAAGAHSKDDNDIAVAVDEVQKKLEDEILRHQETRELCATLQQQLLLVVGQQQLHDDQKKTTERLEKEKQQLVAKLRSSEATREDQEKSLTIRAQQLTVESHARAEAVKQLAAARDEAEQASKSHKVEVERLKHEKQTQLELFAEKEKKHQNDLAALQQRVAQLEGENERMKNIQMHW